MPHRPRGVRDGKRSRAAAPAARGARDAAVAQIAAAFDATAAINNFKLRVERWLCLGPQHPAVRARFRARIAALPNCTLAGAIGDVERWWREERKAFALASALGYGSRLSLETLRELRLILRLMRFKRMAAQFGAIAAALGDDTMALAAE